MKLYLLIMTMLLQAPAPPRTVNGTVIVAGTSEPIADADVAIATASALLETTTDANGRFSLVNVPAGNQTVIVRADGFFAASSTPNALPQARAEVAVAVAQSGASVAPVAMIRGAIITGKVVDTQGKPLPFATVNAMLPGVGPALQAVAARQTDDQGEYRLFWVPPGEYVIGVNPRPISPPNLTSLAAAPIQIFPMVRTLFPSTTDVAQATKVAVKSGDEIRGIDISARLEVMNQPSRQPAPAGLKVSGQITNHLMPTNGPGALLIGSEAEARQPGQIGSVALNAETVPFEVQLPLVPPGKYDLFVRVNDPRGSVGAGGASNAWGRTTIEVGDRDVSGIQMTIHPSVEVPGIFKVDGKAVAGGGILKVGLSPLGVAGRIANYRGILDRAQTPGEGGRFAIPGAAEGSYDVFVQGGPANSYIADIRQGDTSILATGIEVREAVPAPLEVLFATDGGTVEGTASASDKSPAGGATIILAPEDRKLLRLSRIVSAGANGRYSIPGVRPGEYKVFAVTGPLPQGAPGPDLLKYETKGIPVTVKPAAAAKADVSVITD